MGKMTHLCSLYISGNLLRPPLKRFLDDTGINAFTRAKQVVKFLDNLANAVSPRPEVPRGVSPLGIRTLSKIHYSSGSSMYLTGGDAGPGTGTQVPVVVRVKTKTKLMMKVIISKLDQSCLAHYSY